jgi:hypothetical protein
MVMMGELDCREDTCATLRCGVFTVLILAALCLRLAIGGYPVQTGYPFSSSVLLDAGSRILDGQVPHRDFHTPIGFIYLLMVSGFLTLSHGLPHALALLSACTGFLIGIWGWYLTKARCHPALACAFAVTVGLIAASPAYFSYGPLESSYGGHYSRFAWSLFFVVTVQAMVPSQAVPGPSRRHIETCLTGVALGLLAGTKFTFFGTAGFLVVASWLNRKPTFSDLIDFIACAGIVFSIGMAVSGASLGGYLHDCLGVSGTASLTTLVSQYRHQLDWLSLGLISVTAVLMWPVYKLHWQPTFRQPLPWGLFSAALILCFGLILSVTNGIEDASPCYPLVLFILCIGTKSEFVSERQQLLAPKLLCIAVLVALSIRLAIPILKGPYAADTHFATLQAGPWRNLDFMPGVAPQNERCELVPFIEFKPTCVLDNAWFLYLQAGEKLLRGHVAAKERVLSMDFINPFPYMLERPAPLHDHLYWHFDRNITDRNAPSANILFADADWVMVPKISIFHDSAARKRHLYDAWIESHYRQVGENEWWYCWQRVSSPP